MEKINRDNCHFKYDPISESVIETVTGESVYRETGIGEVDVRDVVRGEVHWLGPGNVEDPTQPLFTFDDFVSEIIMPDLDAKNAFAGRSGELWKPRTNDTPTMQRVRAQGNDNLVSFVMESNDIGIDDDDYIFDEEGGYFESMETLVEEMEYRKWDPNA